MTELGTDWRNTCKRLLFARGCVFACSFFGVSNRISNQKRSQCTIHAAQGQFGRFIFKDVENGVASKL
jgi:hypothetical protein